MKKELQVINPASRTDFSNKFRDICKHFNRNIDLATKWGVKVDKGLIRDALLFAENDAERLSFISHRTANVERMINQMTAAIEKAGTDLEQINSVIADMGNRLVQVGLSVSPVVTGAAGAAQTSTGSSGQAGTATNP